MRCLCDYNVCKWMSCDVTVLFHLACFLLEDLPFFFHHIMFCIPPISFKMVSLKQLLDLIFTSRAL